MSSKKYIPYPILSEEERRVRIYCLENNIPSGEASTICKCSQEAYKRWARLHGYVPFRNNGYSEKEIETIREMKAKGFSDEKIGEFLNRSKRSIQYVRKIHNIPRAEKTKKIRRRKVTSDDDKT